MTTTTGEGLHIPEAPSIAGLRFRRPSGDLDDYTAMAELIGEPRRPMASRGGRPAAPSATRSRARTG